MIDPSSVRAEKDQGRPPSEDRLELLRATLHELEKTEGTRPNHPGISHLKWLISKQLAAREFAPPPDSRSSSRANGSLIEKR
jgi:hypothetical protein